MTQEQTWGLFVDWCHARDRSPFLLDQEALDAFAADLPVAPATRAQRERHLRRRLGASTQQPLAQTAWRTGPGWANLSQALAYTPSVGWPRGLRGRRDAYLLVLIHAGLSRAEARDLAPGAIELHDGRVTLLGEDLATHTDPASCPACAVVRWLNAIGMADRRGRPAIRAALLQARRAAPRHACQDKGQPTHWREVFHLLPAIDRHGWITDWRSMSERAISAVVAYRLSQPASTIHEPLETHPSPDDDAGHQQADAAPHDYDQGVTYDARDLEEPPAPRTVSRTPEDLRSMDDLFDVLDEELDAADDLMRRIEEGLAALDAKHDARTRAPVVPGD